MKILHRVSFSVTDEIHRELVSNGISFPIGSSQVINIDESDKNWPFIKAIVIKYRGVDIVDTKFTKNEILQAKACKLTSNWHHGYPEPSGEHSWYLNETYDLKNYCAKCGCGRKQKAPFLLKGEPRWGRRSIFHLHWIYDEFFVIPEVWNLLFKPFGIDCLPVLHYKKRTKLSSVVQLLLPEPAVVVDVSELGAHTCELCGRSKAEPVTRGYFPKIIDGDLNMVARTKNYFGHGGLAFCETVIDAKLVHKLYASGIKEVLLEPLN